MNNGKNLIIIVFVLGDARGFGLYGAAKETKKLRKGEALESWLTTQTDRPCAVWSKADRASSER